MQRLFTSLSRAVPKTRPLAAQLLNKPTPRSLTTTATTNMGSIPTATDARSGSSSEGFLSLVKARRSFYPLNKTLSIPTKQIQSIVSEALQHVPSSFNSQSNRVVVLFGAEHDKFWDITTEILKAVVPESAWQPTGDKMAMFRAAAGTALFYEDQAVVEKMQADFPRYADRYVV